MKLTSLRTQAGEAGGLVWVSVEDGGTDVSCEWGRLVRKWGLSSLQCQREEMDHVTFFINCSNGHTFDSVPETTARAATNTRHRPFHMHGCHSHYLACFIPPTYDTSRSSSRNNNSLCRFFHMQRKLNWALQRAQNHNGIVTKKKKNNNKNAVLGKSQHVISCYFHFLSFVATWLTWINADFGQISSTEWVTTTYIQKQTIHAEVQPERATDTSFSLCVLQHTL